MGLLAVRLHLDYDNCTLGISFQISPHDIAFSHSISQQVNMAWVGHSSIRTTMDIYGHLVAGSSRKASKRFVQAVKQQSA